MSKSITTMTAVEIANEMEKQAKQLQAEAKMLLECVAILRGKGNGSEKMATIGTIRYERMGKK